MTQRMIGTNPTKKNRSNKHQLGIQQHSKKHLSLLLDARSNLSDITTQQAPIKPTMLGGLWALFWPIYNKTSSELKTKQKNTNVKHCKNQLISCQLHCKYEHHTNTNVTQATASPYCLQCNQVL